MCKVLHQILFNNESVRVKLKTTKLTLVQLALGINYDKERMDSRIMCKM